MAEASGALAWEVERADGGLPRAEQVPAAELQAARPDVVVALVAAVAGAAHLRAASQAPPDEEHSGGIPEAASDVAPHLARQPRREHPVAAASRAASRPGEREHPEDGVPQAGADERASHRGAFPEACRVAAVGREAEVEPRGARRPVAFQDAGEVACRPGWTAVADRGLHLATRVRGRGRDEGALLPLGWVAGEPQPRAPSPQPGSESAWEELPVGAAPRKHRQPRRQPLWPFPPASHRSGCRAAS